MLFLRMKQIPPRHILKRWSIHGRDNLPAHLKHYQQDMGPPDAPTFRHSALYITALEVAKMGDRNPEAFDFMMTGLVELKTRGAEVCAPNDGLGVVEQQVSQNVVAEVSTTKSLKVKAACSARSVEGNRRRSRDLASVSVHPAVSQTSEASCPNGSSYMSDYSETASRLMPSVEQDFCAPERNNKRGRPTTSRDKAPYENESTKRSRFCSICRGKGHKSSTCPDRGDTPKKERKVATCGKCGVPGHKRTTCSKPLLSMMPGVSPSH